MFANEKNLLQRLFKTGAPAIGENLASLVEYAREHLVFSHDFYLDKYPEFAALNFDLSVHALLWGFVENREGIQAKNDDSFRKIQFFANSFHGLSNACFFDKNYIAQQLGESKSQFSYIDAVCMYCEYWIKGTPINPNRYFNSGHTASLYGTTLACRQTPATLFLLGAEIRETFQGGEEYKRLIQKPIQRTSTATENKGKPKLFFLSHGAGRTGACLNAFYTAVALRDQGLDVIFLYAQGGELEDEIRARLPAIKVDSPEHFEIILNELSFTHGVVNTITLGNYVAIARNHKIPTISLIHEWSTSILSFGWSSSANEVARDATKIICSSQRGRLDFLSAFPNAASKLHILAQGDYLGNEKATNPDIPEVYKWLRERYSKIIIISGYFDTRKGFDLLPQLIVECNKLESKKYCFVHIGETSPVLSQWIQADLAKAGCDEQVYFLGKVAEPLSYFAFADAMALPSREDPLPTVVMEAVNSGLPVVLFDKSTGFTPADQPLLFETGSIIQADYLDVPDFAKKLQVAVNTVTNAGKENPFSFSSYISKLSEHIFSTHALADAITPVSPTIANISTVVVFHNQARYAWLRLLSIMQQTVLPKQLIIIDDASTDDIAADLAYLIPVLKKRIQDIRLIRNGSGNAGKNTIVNLYNALDQVSENWVWIAEGDDFCSPNFLEEAVAKLDDTVSLYYANSLICNDEGFVVADYADYYNQLPTDQFQNDYRRNGQDELGDWLSIKNTIPNMSSVIVSKTRVKDLDIAKYSAAFGCGDWRFYRDILETGDIVFNSKKLNYHRRHGLSVFGNDRNKNKNELELIEYQAEIMSEGRVFPGIHNFIAKEIRNRPTAGIEVEARKAFLLANIAKLTSSGSASEKKEGMLIVVPDFGAGGGQLVAVDIANEYARRGEVAVYLCAARGFAGLSRTVFRRIDSRVEILNPDDVSLENIEKLNIRRVQSHVYWSDKFVFERKLYRFASWSISMHGCYNDFINREIAYRDFVPLKEIGTWFDCADFIQVCADKHFKAIQYFSPKSLPKSKLIWNGLANYAPCDDKVESHCDYVITQDSSSIHLVMTGRWEPSKGWKLFRDAYIQLKNKGLRNLGKCYLIGPATSELDAAWGDDWDMAGEFVVTGELAQPVHAYGSAALIGVLPSYFHSESQPRVVSEFFSKGIPVVTSEAGDLKQIVGSEDTHPGGLTLSVSGPNQNVESLVAALTEVIRNHQKFSAGAKARFEKYFDVRKSVETIEERWQIALK